MTEEDAQRYLNERTDAMLVLCDNYGYDGILIDYTGLSMVGMQEDVLQQYKARQQNFFSRVLDWRIKHTDKTLVFYGYVQYLAPENMDMLDKYNHLILKTASSKNMEDLTLNVFMAIQAGIDVAEIKYWLHKVQLNGLYRHHQIIPALVFLSSISKRIITIILMEQYVKLFI